MTRQRSRLRAASAGLPPSLGFGATRRRGRQRVAAFVKPLLLKLPARQVLRRAKEVGGQKTLESLLIEVLLTKRHTRRG